MARKREVTLSYQNYIEKPPAPPESLYKQASSGDEVTINAWLDIWLKNIEANKSKLGSFNDHSLKDLFGQYELRPAIIAGSGPSLKYNGAQLKNRKGIPLISCLHNFHFMEDNELEPDYYVSLDAGEVVIEEVIEGGTRSEEEYWSLTRDRKLVCYIGSHPRLLDKWKGEIRVFNAPVPDDRYKQDVEEIETYHTYISNGGNVLGACLYLAKGIFGANPIAFVGADFSFSYDKTFHPWSSKYDKKLGHCLRTFDVFGNKVLTWASYHNFKSWFEYVACQVPGIYINCSEGGTFGSYADGNIMDVKQMDLEEFFKMYQMHYLIEGQVTNPLVNENKILF